MVPAEQRRVIGAAKHARSHFHTLLGSHVHKLKPLHILIFIPLRHSQLRVYHRTRNGAADLKYAPIQIEFLSNT
jgi:hypothetical protein